MIPLELDDSPEQTKRVIKLVAERNGSNYKAGIDFQPWHDYQRWLAAGDLQSTCHSPPSWLR